MGDMADMVNDEDDLLEGFDLPAGLDDLPTLPTNPADELAEMLGEGGTELDRRMEVQRPYFDPDAPGLQSFAVTGDTYPIKDSLKALGCRWNGTSWIAPDAKTFKQACDVRDAHHKRKHQPKPNPRQRCIVVQAAPSPIVQFGAQPSSPKPKRTRIKASELKPGELCAACASARAVEHYHGTPAKYCARCAPLQAAALKAEGFDHNVDVDEQRRRSQGGQIRGALKRASDEQLAEELQSRGFMVEKRSERSLVAAAAADVGLSLEDADAAFEELS